MDKSKILYLVAGVVIGIVFANQIKQLPLVSSIPQV